MYKKLKIGDNYKEVWKPNHSDLGSFAELSGDFNSIHNDLEFSLSKGSYLKNFKNIQTAFASGWMSIRALRKRSGYDKGFAISDHADWDGILEVVKKSEAKNVFFHHGDSEALSKYLVEKESINVLLFGK